MNIRHRVESSQSERVHPAALSSGGKHPARKLKRAPILLAAGAGASAAEIAARVVVGGSTVTRTKRRFVAGNLELAVAENDPKPWRPSAPPPSTTPSPRPKLGACRAAWSSTTPQSTPVGSTWSSRIKES